MKLADIVVPDALCPKLQADSRNKAVRELVEALADAGAIQKKNVTAITKQILARESQATTGIGKGIALPHAKIKSIKKSVVAIGRSSDGLDFSSLDSKPVYSVILLLSSSINPDEHLQAMGTIFRNVQRDIFRKFLIQAETKQAIMDLVTEADEMS